MTGTPQHYPGPSAWRFTVAIAGPLFLVLLAATLLLDGPTPFDRAALLAFRSGEGLPLGPAWLHEAARDLTALGSFTVIGILCAAAATSLLIRGDRAGAAVLLAAVLGAAALNTLLKLAVARPRPDLVQPAVEVFTASFPSGHAAVSASTYLTLAVLAGRTSAFEGLHRFWLALAVALICLIGLSRVYLGVHYPSDILAGWCVGAGWAAGCWTAMSRLETKAVDDGP